MEHTNLLQLPYLMANQAQKHVTHNEALRHLDSIIHVSVIEIGREGPPGNPVEGDRYLLGGETVDEWSGQSGKLAVYADGAWMFYSPQVGWLAWEQATARLMVKTEESWQQVGNDIGPGAEIDGVAFLGINAAASTSERLAVQSPSILFNHDGNDHRLKINKALEQDTASLLFQSGFSGRAEIGLAGEDNFSIKVSRDGTTWQSALAFDPFSGTLEMPSSGITFSPDLISSLLPDSGRFNPVDQQDRIEAPLAQVPSYLQPFNGSLFKFPFRFKNNNSTFGGAGGPLNTVVKSLMEAIRGAEGVRYGPEFWCMKVEAGAGTDSEVNIGGTTFYRATNSHNGPRPTRYTTGFYLKSNVGQTCIVPPTGELRVLSRDDAPVDYATHDVIVDPSDGWVYFELQVSNPDQTVDLDDMALYLTSGGSCFIALPRVVPGWVSLGKNRSMVLNNRIFGG